MSTASPTTSAPSRPPRSSGSDAGAPRRPCANCGAALGGSYCAACGQRDAPLDPTVRELAVDAALEVLGVDGRLLSTFRHLLRPGRLTADYLAGRRAAQVGPVRIYLVSSAVLFALLALQPPEVRPAKPDEFRILGGLAVTVRMDDTTAARLERSRHATVFDRATLRMRTAVRAGRERHAELEQRTINAIPQAFFLMVPAYAAAMWLLAPRPRRHYPAHLCYALHVHAFAFAALAVALGARTLARQAADARTFAALDLPLELLTLAAGIGAVAYAFAAHRRVYGATWPATLARVAGSTALYLLLLSVALVVLVLAVLLVG